MDSEIVHLEGFYRVWAWVEKNRRQFLWAVLAGLVIGLGVYFHAWRKETAEQTAAEELSKLRPAPSPSGTPIPVTAEAYLKVASEHPGTQAAGRAMLLAAGSVFAEGKYPEAKAQFDRFLRELPDSPLRGEALFGNAACLEAQGDKAKAIEAYKEIVDHRPNDPLLPRAKLGLARCYEATKQPGQAYQLYEDLSQTESFNSVGLMADVRLEALKQSNPDLALRRLTNTVVVKPGGLGTNRIVLPKAVPAVVKTNKP